MQGLEYYIASKAPVKIVTLVGTWNQDSSVVLQNCLKELESEATGGEYLIIYARDLQDISPQVYKEFIQFQSKMRMQFSGGIKLCSLLPKIRNDLINQGIIRANEVTNNLKDTLTQIINNHG